MKEGESNQEALYSASKEERARVYPGAIGRDPIAQALFDEGVRCIAGKQKYEGDASTRSFFSIRAGLVGQMLAKVYPVLDGEHESEFPLDDWLDAMTKEGVARGLIPRGKMEREGIG